MARRRRSRNKSSRQQNVTQQQRKPTRKEKVAGQEEKPCSSKRRSAKNTKAHRQDDPFLAVKNDGETGGGITFTNFWETPYERHGIFHVSSNAKTFRLLVPSMHVDEVREGIGSVKEVIVSRGPWASGDFGDGLDLLFEDGSAAPFSITVCPEQCDRLPLKSEHGRTDLMCRVYGPGCEEIATFPAKFRFTNSLPCPDKWTNPMIGEDLSTSTFKEKYSEVQDTIDRVLRGFNNKKKKYSLPLPPPLGRWYCYPPDSGHSIMCVLEQHFEKGMDNTGNLVPVPVKSVLRGYRIEDQYVVVDLPYDQQLGLIAPSEDDEY